MHIPSPRNPSYRATYVAVAFSALAFAGACQANPTGPSIISGTATFEQSGPVLQVNNSANAILNWQGFSIGNGETTRFVQPSAASAVLNRVTGQDPSAILGTLQSNGRVFLINPNGILFGSGAQIDVAGLVASSLALSDADFLSGRMRFEGTAQAGAVTNFGLIRSRGANAPVYLVGPSFSNGGIINSPQGEVILAAGHSVEIRDPGTPNVSVVFSASDNRAVNLGAIVAESGRVNLVGALVSQQGLIQANRAETLPDGRIVLRGSKSVDFSGYSGTYATGGLSSIDVQAPTVTVGHNANVSSELQSIQATGNLMVDGGSLQANRSQTISVGGDLTVQNWADITSGDVSATGVTQTINVGGTLTARDRGIVQVLGSGEQAISASNVSLIAGNYTAQPAAIVSGGSQHLRINNGGSVTMQAGIGNGVSITAQGDQVIDFTAGGSLSLTGGSFAEGSGGSAIVRSNAGNQLIRGYPDIRLTGGTGAQSHAVIEALAGSQTIEAGTVSLIGGSGDGSYAAMTGARDLTLRALGDVTLQGGSGRGAYALIGSGGNIDLTVGGGLRLNEGSGRDAWARVQTQDRNATIGLHFSSAQGAWFVNGTEGAIRRGQTGLLSGNGAAVRGRTLLVSYD